MRRRHVGRCDERSAPFTPVGCTHPMARIGASIVEPTLRRTRWAAQLSAGRALVGDMSGRFATSIAIGRGYQENNFQCPSETISTVPSVTLMAVWSSIAYAGPAISAAHLSAAAMVLSGR